MTPDDPAAVTDFDADKPIEWNVDDVRVHVFRLAAVWGTGEVSNPIPAPKLVLRLADTGEHLSLGRVLPDDTRERVYARLNEKVAEIVRSRRSA